MENTQTAIEWLIEQLEQQIVKSAHNKLGTVRTGEYRIGLRKAIDFAYEAKDMETEQRKQCYDNGYANGQMDLITT